MKNPYWSSGASLDLILIAFSGVMGGFDLAHPGSWWSIPFALAQWAVGGAGGYLLGSELGRLKRMRARQRELDRIQHERIP